MVDSSFYIVEHCDPKKINYKMPRIHELNIELLVKNNYHIIRLAY